MNWGSMSNGSGSGDRTISTSGDLRRSLSGEFSTQDDQPHLDTLVAACKECVGSCNLLRS